MEPGSTNLLTILVVDDSPASLGWVAHLLKGRYTVKLANRGAKALEIARECPPDLVLLDVAMPDMDGFQVCRMLKALPGMAAVPVVFLTARTDLDDEERGFEAGAVDYIHKPISPPIVRARIQAHLRNARHLTSLPRREAGHPGALGGRGIPPMAD